MASSFKAGVIFRPLCWCNLYTLNKCARNKTVPSVYYSPVSALNASSKYLFHLTIKTTLRGSCSG